MVVPFFRPAIGEEEIEAVVAVMRTGWLTTGPRAAEFEAAMVEFLGGGLEAVAVNSATAGLHLALEAIGIGPGDKVLVPTLTFTATAEVVRYLGAEVVLVDSDPTTLLIDLDDAGRRMTPDIKAIMPVHFGGLAMDNSALQDFARRHSLQVVEDAAHALPSSDGTSRVGTSESAATVFSFYANKTITTGEGGMLVTRDRALAARARQMRSHGISSDAFDRFRVTGASWEYDVVAPGFKYNLGDLAAAIGLVQLAKAEKLRAQRQAIAERYFANLSDLPLQLPARAADGAVHSWHLYPILLDYKAAVGRDELIAELNGKGIGASVHYRPLHRMTYWRELNTGASQSFPVADRYFDGCVSLPLFPGMTEAECDEVCDVIRSTVAP